jgi:fibronectin type 3 domain-containing protein
MFKNLYLFFLLLLFSGCGGINVAPSKPLTQDPSLQKVEKIKTKSDRQAIAFEWFPIGGDRIAGYNIYRMEITNSDSGDKRLIRVAHIDDPATSHYVDKDLQPNRRYKYRFTTFTADGRESLGSESVTVKTMEVFKPLHYIVPVDGLANKTKLIWRPHPGPMISGYIIERSDIYNPQWKKVGELDHRLDAEFIDRGLETNKIYRYRIFAKGFDNLLSKPSKTIETSTKARPKPVQEIIASVNLPREIRVEWRASDEGVRGYKIYRSRTNGGHFEEIDESPKNSYSDKVTGDGIQMFYKISAVDQTGLESILNDVPIMGSSLSKPKTPKVTKVASSTSEIRIDWEATDSRSLRYVVERKSSTGWTTKDPKKFETNKTYFVDKDVVKEMRYIYKVRAIDKNGIVSDASVESEASLQQQ